MVVLDDDESVSSREMVVRDTPFFLRVIPTLNKTKPDWYVNIRGACQYIYV
jgi:hypothetical protein